MKLDAEHFFLRTMDHIDASIKFHKYITSFLEPEGSEGVVITNKFTFSIGRYDCSFLHPLKRSRQLSNLYIQILTYCLASEANPQKWSIATLCNDFPQTIHLRVVHIVDIARSSPENDDIFSRHIFFIGRDGDFCSERLYHDSEDVGEIIIEIDNCHLFSDQFRR